MSPTDRKLARVLETKLEEFSRNTRPLRGIRASAKRSAFVGQLVDSVHRIRYVEIIRERDVSPFRMDPTNDLFDPLKAAILHNREGRIDEAFWLTFLSVHFGKNLRTGWRLLRDVYGSLDGRNRWDWARISANPTNFRQWLGKNQHQLEGGDGVRRHFGNHRKYQSLDANSANGTGAALMTYVQWVKPPRSHEQLYQEVLQGVNNDSRKAFNNLYNSLEIVASFGRMAKFDYLTMVGKLGLAAIEPPSAYMQGATGPLTGSKLLFDNSSTSSISRHEIERWIEELDKVLGLPFGMQVLEDAICNWQKTPDKFKRFRG